MSKLFLDRAQLQLRRRLLVRDLSRRTLVAPELAKSFCFLQLNPASRRAPVASAPDELGEAWR